MLRPGQVVYLVTHQGQRSISRIPRESQMLPEILPRISQGKKKNKEISLGHKAQLQPKRDKALS